MPLRLSLPLCRQRQSTLPFATIVTALPTTAVHASEKQYWTESAERVGIVEKVMNDGSIGSTFNEGHMTVEGEDAFCVDINTNFRNGYKTRADASTRMSYPYNAEVELINPVADTVANANYRGADVEWYIKADDIVLKNKGGQPAGNPQNHAPQGQQKK